MKKSNIIIISFFGFIALFMLSNSFNIPKKRRIDDINYGQKSFKKVEKEIDKFDFLVVKGDGNVKLVQSKTYKIDYFIPADSVTSKKSFQYHYHGDTLFFKRDEYGRSGGITIGTPKVNAIYKYDNSQLVIRLKQEGLSMNSFGGSVRINDNSNFNWLQINLKNTNLIVYNKNLLKLDAKLYKSSITAHNCNVDSLSLKMNTNSKCVLNAAHKINCNADKSSQLRIH